MVFVLCDWLFPLSLTSLQWEDFQSPCRDPWAHIATPGCSPWNVWGGLSLQGPTRGRSSGNCTGFEGLLCPRGVPLPSGLVFKFILPPRGTHLEGKLTKSHPSPILLVAVQLLSDVRVFVTPWTAARQASLSFTISLILFKLTSLIESRMPFSRLLLCRLLLLLPSIFPSIRIFSNDSVLRILNLLLQQSLLRHRVSANSSDKIQIWIKIFST